MKCANCDKLVYKGYPEPESFKYLNLWLWLCAECSSRMMLSIIKQEKERDQGESTH